TVSVSATDNMATEAELTNTGTFTFTRTRGTDAALTVSYQVTGTATSGSDHDPLDTSVQFLAGEESVTKTVTPKQDDLQEFDETVVLTLAESPNYAVDTPNSATVTLISDEVITQTVSVSATDNMATEVDLTTGAFTFTRTGGTDAALTVSYQVTGTATADSDYDSLSTSVEFAAGAVSVTKTVTPKQDDLQEFDETVVLTLAQSPNYAVGAPNSATVTIISDD
ncbi:MAG: hypothetical protein L0Y39_04080, partial [Methylococcaceae bacterium]|nr:hypothetical protein [Methylococcaceae bacterium]